MTNSTYRNETLRLSWPPSLSFYREEIEVTEDSPYRLRTEILDSNQIGHVDISISSPRVSYEQTLGGRLVFTYTNETILREEVYVNLTDGYDSSTYRFSVNVTPVDDPVGLTLLSNPVFGVMEDTPYRIYLELEDEDTPLDSIEVWTNDTAHISYDRESISLVLNYGDGTPELSQRPADY